MGRRNSLSNLVNLQRFRHHGPNSPKHDEESTKPVKPLKVRSLSSSTLEGDGDSVSNSLFPKHSRRHSTGHCPSKSVRFGECQIRSYPQVLGDHPYCSMGCPVELGWEYIDENQVEVEDFEEERNHQRRHKGELLLSPEERRDILSLNEENTAALRKACRRQCTRKAQRKIQREFFAN